MSRAPNLGRYDNYLHVIVLLRTLCIFHDSAVADWNRDWRIQIRMKTAAPPLTWEQRAPPMWPRPKSEKETAKSQKGVITDQVGEQRIVKNRRSIPQAPSPRLAVLCGWPRASELRTRTISPEASPPPQLCARLCVYSRPLTLLSVYKPLEKVHALQRELSTPRDVESAGL